MSNKPDNLALWRRVEETDPSHTKQVTFGRRFTAIDPHYQIRNATREFGPLGQNWSYKATYHTESLPLKNFTLAIADVTIFWRDPDNDITMNQFGPIRGSDKLEYIDNKGKHQLDTDAYKKACTDALTKGLSQLGFNADVFLGKFDDNKYVQQRRKEEHNALANAHVALKHPPEPKEIDPVVHKNNVAKWLIDLSKCNSGPEISALKDRIRPAVRQLPRDYAVQMSHAFKAKTQEVMKNPKPPATE